MRPVRTTAAAAPAGRSRRRRPPRTDRRTRGPDAGSGSRVMIRRPKLRIVRRPPASSRTTTTPIAKTIWTSAGRPLRNDTKPAASPSGDDREQVEDPLDEDRPERPRQGDGAVDLEQVRAVDVAELGRHEAVHEPRQEDDLRASRTLSANPVWRTRKAQRRPAEREPDVEDDEGRRAAATGWRRRSCRAAGRARSPGGPRQEQRRSRAGSAGSSEIRVRGWRSRFASES